MLLLKVSLLAGRKPILPMHLAYAPVQLDTTTLPYLSAVETPFVICLVPSRHLPGKQFLSVAGLKPLPQRDLYAYFTWLPSLKDTPSILCLPYPLLGSA